jgi:hypothetical protein
MQARIKTPRGQHGSHQDRWRKPAQWRHSDFRREKRGLPLMIASLLTDDTLTLENLPHLADVEQLQRILGNHGVDIGVVGRRERQGEAYARTVHFTARTIVDTTAPYELVSKMRASFWVIGPLARPHGRGAGLAARRLCHRHPPGRSVYRRA